MGREARSNVNLPAEGEPKLAKVFKTKPRWLSEKKAEEGKVTEEMKELQTHQPMQSVFINLTKKQIEQLQPLFDLAKEGVANDSLGSILCQAWEHKNQQPSNKPVLQCIFLGEERAKEVSDVIRGITHGK